MAALALGAAVLGAAVALGGGTHAYVHIWRTRETMWAWVVAQDGRDPGALNQYANALQRRGLHEQVPQPGKRRGWG